VHKEKGRPLWPVSLLINHFIINEKQAQTLLRNELGGLGNYQNSPALNCLEYKVLFTLVPDTIKCRVKQLIILILSHLRSFIQTR
jgi:hypothetical protein